MWELPAGELPASPYWYAHLPASIAERVLEGVAARSMLIRCIIDLWGEGTSWEDLHANVMQYEPVEKAKYGAPDQSFRFVVDSRGSSVSLERRIEIIEGFIECTEFRGCIDLKTPMHDWWAIETSARRLNNLPLLPQRCYFGRQIAVAQTGVGRARLTIYDLKKRRYLGPTSMDPELSFMMCAMGGVRRSSLMLDPFVGTGSVMVAAAELGAYTIGTDIDIRVIKLGKKDKKGHHVNIWSNFRDYQLPPPLGLLRADLHLPPFRSNLEEFVDAVVADPPYGVRAGARKSHAKEGFVIEDRTTHIPSTAPYCMAECLRDLVNHSAKWLTVNGKLVYWIPAAPGFYFEEELPRHPAMVLEANCEQVLTGRYSRRLIVMRKVKKYDAEEVRAFYAAAGAPKMKLDEFHGHIYAEDDGNTEDGWKKKSDGGDGAMLTFEEKAARAVAKKQRKPRFRTKFV